MRFAAAASVVLSIVLSINPSAAQAEDIIQVTVDSTSYTAYGITTAKESKGDFLLPKLDYQSAYWRPGEDKPYIPLTARTESEDPVTGVTGPRTFWAPDGSIVTVALKEGKRGSIDFDGMTYNLWKNDWTLPLKDAKIAVVDGWNPHLRYVAKDGDGKICIVQESVNPDEEKRRYRMIVGPRNRLDLLSIDVTFTPFDRPKTETNFSAKGGMKIYPYKGIVVNGDETSDVTRIETQCVLRVLGPGMWVVIESQVHDDRANEFEAPAARKWQKANR